MQRRLVMVCLSAVLIAGLSACHSKKVDNPLATVGSKQPDKVLFDRAMLDIKNKKYDTARMTLQTLINTYPDSEYLARAKMALGDSWMAEGGAAALAQAESEYKDFITFFPNLPDAAEAQMKVANIEFDQMEKPDRDYVHTKRAEAEYRQMILQYPDSKLIPEAKERLREVQESLGQREFEIGRFYYLRESWPAAIARLESLVSSYPLYSLADEALLMAGDAYEQQAETVKASKVTPEQKKLLIQYDQDHAAAAYSRLITRYPASDQAREAARRLEALHLPVPTPAPAAIARNKAEIASRGKPPRRWDAVWRNLRRRPYLEQTTKVGDPSLFDPKPTNATDIVRNAMLVMEGKAGLGTGKLSVETVNGGAPPPNEAVPHSPASAPTTGNGNDSNGIPELAPISSAPSASDTASDPNAAPKPAPPQVNEAGKQEANNATPAATATGDGSAQTNFSGNQESSSKNKKKKGFLKKMIPF